MVFFSRLRALPLLLVVAQTCQAAMTAWMTDAGPQLMIQNMTTGAIMYSDCNSTKTPVYTYDPDKSFKLTYPPRNGTALAGVGWWTGKMTV